MVLILDNKFHLLKPFPSDITSAQGVVEGKISAEIRGDRGFGYDPIFIPDSYKKTFAEMTVEEKNSISHRSIAIKKLKKYLLTLI